MSWVIDALAARGRYAQILPRRDLRHAILITVAALGKRIYHVPGQKYYDEIRISASHSERWFCSEEEARAAGWRKAKV
ncbi:hypothetical protein [Devosia sp. 2618]|uniref:sunset domain-containing protein n=1 Tax=Devosia sp. 2618 TaxID=3156454 RepID=UPI0033984E71